MLREQMNIRLHPETMKELNYCSEKLRTTKTGVIERALLAFFARECPQAQPAQADRTEKEEG